MANNITASTYPTTQDVTSQVLALMAAKSGVLTDYNVGSQIRTQTESLGNVVESQGIWTQAICFQVLLYSAMSAYGIFPQTAIPASGSVNVQTVSAGVGPPASQNVSVPSGTLVATVGGFQYASTADTLLTAGSSGVSITAIASTGGLAGNAAASAVQNVVTSLGYPLFAINPNPMVGGLDAETSAQTLARFTALRASLGLSSPGAIANAAFGTVASGTGETVLFATCFEPWAAAGSGAGSGTAGYSVIVDNGLGAASSGLIAAVTAKLNGPMVSGATNAGASGIGYHDAGVPYGVFAVTPSLATVSISGVVGPLTTVSAMQSAFQAAVSGYNRLQFGQTAQQSMLNAAVANSAPGLMNSLTVALRVSGSGTSVTGITPPVSGRVYIGGVSLNLTQGT